MKGRGQLTEAQETELAALQPKTAQQKQQKTAKNAKRYQAIKAAAARVAELEKLQERGPLTEGQEAELAALQPKVAQQKQQQKAYSAKYYQGLKAAVDRVAVLEELQGRGQLTEEQEAELAALQPKAERKQQQKAKKAKDYQGLKAAVDRVAVLEELAGRGPLTEGQEAELAALRPKVAQQKQQQKAYSAKYYQGLKAAVDRVAVLEELQGRGQLTEVQEAELAALQSKVAQQKQQQKAYSAKYYQGLKAAVDRVAVLEELAGRGPLTEGQEAELAALRPKVAQQKQQQKAYSAKYYQGLKAAVDRVAVLEELQGRGQLTEVQEAELAALQSKVAQQKQQQKAYSAKYYQGLKAAVDRVAVLEELQGRGQLTEEQAAELGALRLKVAGRGRKKKDREVMETGVSGAGVAGRVEWSAGPEGVSEWTGADQGDRDAWLADFDLGAWLDQAVADSAVSGDAGAGGAGVMLGEGAYEEFVATELTAFLGQDAGDDAGAGGAGAVAGGDDFAGFLPDYHDWEGLVGLSGVDWPDGGSFGEPFPVDAVSPNAVWPDAVGVAVGFGYRFVRG